MTNGTLLIWNHKHWLGRQSIPSKTDNLGMVLDLLTKNRTNDEDASRKPSVFYINSFVILYIY